MNWRKLLERKPTPAHSLSRTFNEAREYQSANYQLKRENAVLTKALAEQQADQRDADAAQLAEARRYLAEMIEAQAMCGSGPWMPGNVDVLASQSKPLREALRLQEAGPVGGSEPLGAYGMYELLLQNVGWQREINYSWLEFSRWGIQQIMLICRLYWLKNPIPRRLVNVRAEYTFARGVDMSSSDPDANEAIKRFVERNKSVLGEVALTEGQRSKDRDGNRFYCFFTDMGKGECSVRVIDATEIMDIITDPEDASKPQYYKRQWTQKSWDMATGTQTTTAKTAWYPAINFEPDVDKIGADPVMKDCPIYHRKVGEVGGWLFGCPPMYPMIDWAKESRRFLEACASVRQSLSQFAFKISTKGGQQAIEGIKQQMETQVGPGSPIWDTNPPAVAGASWISGPGTNLDAFKVQGATFSPDDVRWYVIFCCMCFGLPPTFLGDMQTSNLATATSLDRPTETMFLAIQREWIEDLTVILVYGLERELRAPAGKLREACPAPGAIRVRPAKRVTLANGRSVSVKESAAERGDDIDVRVDFPAIREGDMPALVKATVEALTLDNKGGQVVGIDERAGVLNLMRLLDFENADDLIEEMYPSKGKDAYDPLRADDELPPPVPKLEPQAGPIPPQGEPKPPTKKAAEALRKLAEAMDNGTAAR